MPAGQGEARQVMAEDYPAPITGGMTQGADCPKPPVMLIVLRVAGKTVGRDSFENPAKVTLCAFHLCVCAIQLEVEQVVVNDCIFPVTGRVVTGGAILAVLAIVFIVLFMAGIAIICNLFTNAVTMTVLALCFGVFSLQFEAGQVVIKLGRAPPGRCMAFPAGWEFFPVRIIRAVAGLTGDWQNPQIGWFPGVDVTTRTGYLEVFPI